MATNSLAALMDLVGAPEFAGGFFGKYGISLNVQDKEAACQAQ